MLGSGCGPFLMGTIFQKTGSYDLGLLILGCGLAVASVLMLRLGPYRFGVSSHAAPARRAVEAPVGPSGA
jgi:cyanate permease